MYRQTKPKHTLFFRFLGYFGWFFFFLILEHFTHFSNVKLYILKFLYLWGILVIYEASSFDCSFYPFQGYFGLLRGFWIILFVLWLFWLIKRFRGFFFFLRFVDFGVFLSFWGFWEYNGYSCDFNSVILSKKKFYYP